MAKSKELVPVNKFDNLLKEANAYSLSDLIPAHFKGKTANCIIALELSRNLNLPFLTVVNGIDVIQGKPSFKSTFLASLVNKSGLFKNSIFIEYSGEGDSLVATASAERIDGQKCVQSVSMAMAKAEGWAQRNPKYRSMPQLMLGYRAISFFVKLFCPQVTMGLASTEEMIDIEHSQQQQQQQPIVIDENNKTSAEQIKNLIGEVL
jgi:hypothetical protein